MEKGKPVYPVAATSATSLCQALFFTSCPDNTEEGGETEALPKGSKVSGLWPLMSRRCNSITALWEISLAYVSKGHWQRSLAGGH